MCFILTAIKIEENDLARQGIFQVLKEEQIGNPHGTGALCFNKDNNRVTHEKTMHSDWDTMKANVDNFDIINYHFRLATIGEKNVENVHFWKHGDWYFAHNGIIGGLGTAQESDSLIFFKELVRQKLLQKNGNVKCTEVKAYANTLNFGGRFLLVNTKTKNMYFFGDWNVCLLNKSYLAITSSSASFDIKYTILGLEFDQDIEIEKMEATMDGVWMYESKTKEFKQIFYSFKEYKKPTSTGTGSRPRQTEVGFTKARTGAHTHKKGGKREEGGNTSRKEKEVVNKERTDESYIKEFYNRLVKELDSDKMLVDIWKYETEHGDVNVHGRTQLEQMYWDKWITPKLPKGKEISFDNVAQGIGA